MKKLVSILLSIISVVCLTISFAGCTEKGDKVNFIPEGKEIIKIQSNLSFGEVLLYYDPIRTFDFSAGTVTDAVTMSEEHILYQGELYTDDPARFPKYSSAEEYKNFLRSNYNFTEQVSVFSSERADCFLQKAAELGFWDWEKSYENNSSSCGTYYLITVFFSDGTQKKVSMYNARPENYEQVESAFKEYLGAEIFFTK